MGSGRSSYADASSASGTKRWRGTVRIASRTRGSRIPRAAIWRSTMSFRSDGKRPVVVRGRFLRERDEEVAGHGAHRFEDARIPNPARRDLALDHVVPLLLHGIGRT